MNKNAPNVIEPLDFESILRRRKDSFISLWPENKRPYWANTLGLESEPVTKLLELAAYLELLLRARINDAAAANLLEYARAGDLDRLADFYGVERFEGEDDAAFRRRISERIRASSTAGPAAHYRYHALSASPDVADAHVDSPNPGLVRVSIISKKDDGSEDLVSVVRSRLMRDDVRVLTDTLDVRYATVKTVDIVAVISPLPSAPPIEALALENTLRAAIKREMGLGRDLTRSWIIRILHVEGVKSVELTSPTEDVTIAADQIAAIGTLSVKVANRST